MTFPSCSGGCWKASLFAPDGTTLLAQKTSTSNTATTVSLRTHAIQTGNYTLVVEVNTTFSNQNFSINGTFISGLRTAEFEPNNSPAQAVEMNNSEVLTGQLISAADKDHYFINSSGSGVVTIDVSFPSCSGGCWKASLLAPDGAMISQKTSTSNTATVVSLSGRSTIAGVFTVVLESNTSFSSLDYTIKGLFVGELNTVEAEPNENTASGTTINDGLLKTGQLMLSGDKDHYFITSTGSGTVSTDVSFPACSGSCWKASLIDPSGATIAQKTSTSNTATTVTLRGNSNISGTYTILIETNTSFSNQDYSIRGLFLSGLLAAESESNDSVASATAMSIGNVRVGQLMLATDKDHFKLNAIGSGTVAFDVTFPNCSGACWKVSMLAPDGAVISRKTSTSNTATTVTLRGNSNISGTYTILIETNTSFSNQDYSISASFIAGLILAEAEPNGDDIEFATSMSGGIIRTGQLMENADKDYFFISSTGSGTVSIDVSFPSCSGVCWKASLFAPDGAILAQKTSTTNTATTISLNGDSASSGTFTALIEMNTSFSNQDYTIKGLFVGGLRSAEAEPNNSNAAATVLTDGISKTGQLLSSTDIDVYSIEASTGDDIRVDLSFPSCSGSCWKGSLLSADGSTLLSQKTSISNTASTEDLVSTNVIAGVYFVVVERNSATSNQDYTIKGSSFTSSTTNEIEPNNLDTQATTLSSGIAMTGQISTTTDVDYFKIEASQSGQISVDLKVTTNCVSVNCWIVSILDSSNNLLAQNSAGAYGANISGLTATASVAGTYFVKVERSTHSQQNYSLTTTFP